MQELELLRGILLLSLDGIEGAWAYVVERGSGKFIASSTDKVYSFANASRSEPVRESAQMLQRRSWPADQDVNQTRANVGWEAHTVIHRGDHGLDWLVVAGQNLNCSQNQIWDFGRCLDCPPGQAPAAGGAECENCPLQGQVPDAEGLCAPCPAGFHADEHQVECEVCPAGKYSGSADLQCESCSGSATVPNGQRTACECAQQHYNSTRNRWRCFDSDYLQLSAHSDSDEHCEECPPCAVCAGDDAPPQLKPGFRAWDEKAGVSVQRAFLCTSSKSAKKACTGNATLPCAVGHTGRLCQSCAELYYKSGHECAECDDGSVLSSEALYLLLLVLLILGWKYRGRKYVAEHLRTYLKNQGDVVANTVGGVMSEQNSVDNPLSGDGEPEAGGAQLERTPSELRRSFKQKIAKADPDKIMTVAFRSIFTPVRTVITYVQVTAQIGRVLHIELPAGYMRDVVNGLKPLLEMWELVISMECHGLGGFHNKWMRKAVFLPLTLLVVIFGMFAYDLKHAKDDLALKMAASAKVKTNMFFSIFFVCKFTRNHHHKLISRDGSERLLVFPDPTICNVLFSTFNCRDVGEESSVLLEDDRVLCEDHEHLDYQHVSEVYIVLFALGLPVCLLVVLLKRRREIEYHHIDNLELVQRVAKHLGEDEDDNDPTPLTETKANILVRDVRDGQDVAFLLQSYKPSRHYWECLDMARKLCLVGLVLRVGRGSPAQVLVAVLMSGFFLSLHVKQWPFKDASDNWFRMATEIHVFITFTVCLALRGDRGGDDDPSAESFEQTTTWLTFLSFLVLVPGAFFVTVYLKIKRSLKLMQRTELKTECSAAQRMLRGLADEQDVSTLRDLFEKIENEIETEKQKLQLTDKDARILVWVREHFEMDMDTSDEETISQVQKQLQLSAANDGRDWADVVKEIQQAIVQSSEVQDGIFLSHYQMFGPDVMDLKQRLINAGMDGGRVWYDKDNDPSEKSMREGVRDSKYFLLYLTEGVLERPFCRKEIHWCLHYKKEIVLLWKQEGDGSVASFNQFFADCGKELWAPHENSHVDLVNILVMAAVPYYLQGDFHDASMSELLRRVGHVDAVAPEPLYGFEGGAPKVHIGYSKEKVTHARVVQDGLGKLAPQLADQVTLGLGGTTALEGGHTGAVGDVVLVYLTEGLFDDADFVRGLKEILQKRDDAAGAAKGFLKLMAAQKTGADAGMGGSMPIIWVVESDMRHGWQNYQNADWDARSNHTWRDGLKDLKTHIPAEFWQKEWIKPEMFGDEVVPFYKDSCFRSKSLACIAKAMGAKPSAELPPQLSAELPQMGLGRTGSRPRNISTGEGSPSLTRQAATAAPT